MTDRIDRTDEAEHGLARNRDDLDVFADRQREWAAVDVRRHHEHRLVRREADDAARMHRAARVLRTNADQRADRQVRVFQRERCVFVVAALSVARPAGRILGLGLDVAAARLEVREEKAALFRTDDDRAAIEQQRAVGIDDRPFERRADRHRIGVEKCGGRVGRMDGCNRFVSLHRR